MVWSVVSSKGVGFLHVVNGTMKQGQYKEILETRLIPQLALWYPDGEDFIFMHDSAPCHKAKSVTTFLEQKNIPVLQWPGNSPDMNPIENLWEVTKREMSKETITNREELISKLTTVWYESSDLKEILKSCITSMPSRIKALIAAKGGVTKY